MDEPAAAWSEIGAAYLRHALGEATADVTIATVRQVVEAAGLQNDVRARKLIAVLTTSKDNEAKRQKALHEARNGASAVIATVELAEWLVQHAGPVVPFPGSATPADQAELIEALRRAVLAAKSLAAVVEEVLDVPARGVSRGP